MYQLSLWARNHVWPARFLIVAAYLFLNITGWLLGEQLALNNIYLSQAHFYIGTALVLAGFFAYPSNGVKKHIKHFYRFQKSCDGLLVSGTFVLIVCLSQPQSLPQPWMGFSAQAATVTPSNVQPAPQAKQSIFRKVANGAIRWLGVDKAVQKKIQKNAQKLMAEYKRSSNGGKVALAALTILVAVFLAMLVLSWSCSLSCNGSDAAAILVGVLGMGLIIFLSVKVINRINRGPKHERPKPPPDTTSIL